MKKILSLLVAYFVLVGQAFAVTGVPDNLHWEYAGFGGAGAFPQIKHDHFTSGKLYGIPDVNSPFVTTNKAESWSFLSTVGSVNSGFTPTQTASFTQSKTDANLMFAIDSASGGLARSLDGGQTWTKVASFGNIKGQSVIAIDKDDDNKVYVASYSTLYKSTDKGVTWTSLGRVFGSRAGAYTTQSTCTSAGGSWSTSLSLCTVNIAFVYHDTVNEDLYLGSNRFGIVKYDLATDTQEYIDFTGTNALRNMAFDTYVDGSSVENFCVSTGNRIACTADFSTWTYTAVLTTSSSYYIDTFAIHRKADTSLNIVANRVLTSSGYTNSTHYSTDGGATWSGASRVNNTTMNPTGAYNSGNGILWIEDSPFVDGEFYLTTDWRFYRSDNSGQTFNEKVVGAPMQVAHDVAISPNGRIFQVSMDTGVQYSDDFGATWIQGTPDASKGQPYVTGSINDYGGHYWQVETAGTFEEWEAGQGKVYIAATMYGTNSAIYYVNFVLKSVDGGVTWTRSNSGLPTVRLFGDATWGLGYARALGLSKDESVLYVGMDGQGSGQTGGLFRSDDDGETFVRVWPTTPNRIFNALEVDPTDSTGNTLMFGTFGTQDYGATYRLTKVTSESAELDGTGQTRTGSFNRTGTNLNPVFTSSGGEIFTPITVGSDTLVSNLGGSGTFSGYYHTYSLTFVSEPSSTTVTYDVRDYVLDSNGPGKWVVDIAYDSQGTPYAVSQVSGPRIYKSVTTAYGDGSGQYGTWQLMKNFGSSGLPDGIAIDPQNDKRIFVSVTEGSPSARRIYVTPNADKHNQSTWYDITGDFPVSGGCRALRVNYFEGTQGYLYCASNGGGIWKLNLADSPSATPGRTCIGGCNE